MVKIANKIDNVGLFQKKSKQGVEDIHFPKTPLEVLDLSLYPKKFLRKQALTPGNSAKLSDTPRKFQKPRSKTKIHGNYTIFSYTPLEIQLLF